MKTLITVLKLTQPIRGNKLFKLLFHPLKQKTKSVYTQETFKVWGEGESDHLARAQLIFSVNVSLLCG